MDAVLGRGGRPVFFSDAAARTYQQESSCLPKFTWLKKGTGGGPLPEKSCERLCPQSAQALLDLHVGNWLLWFFSCAPPQALGRRPKIKLRQVALEMSSCSFDIDTCAWLKAGNASWQRASGQGSGGWLEADGNVSDGQALIVESPIFTPTAAEKGLVFSYMMTGLSSVLEVEHKTEFANWSTLFADSGDTGATGAAWKGSSIRVPEGTVGLRLRAAADVGAVVKMDWILAVERANWANIGCTFEVGFCGWSSGFDERRWAAQRGPTLRAANGPGQAFEGDGYIHAQALDAYNEAGCTGARTAWIR